MQGFRVSGTGSHLAMALAGALVALTAGPGRACVRPRDRHDVPRDAARLARSSLRLSRRRRAWGWGCWRSRRSRSASPRRGWSSARATASRRSAGAAAVGHISQPGWLIEPGYARLREHQPDRARAHADRFCARCAACIRYLASLRRARRVPVWASGVAVTGRRVQYTPIGYANMVRVIFNVVYRVRTQLRTIGDQRFPER